ncbi:MAG: hypothetical protein ACFE0O_06610 [Opitutales bacterium]
MKKEYIHLLIIALFLAATNWHSTKEFDRENGLTKSSIDAAALGIVVGLYLGYRVTRKVYSLLRDFLDRGHRIKRDVKLFSWMPLWFLLPLSFHWEQTAIFNEDGANVTYVYGYGSDATFLLIILGVYLIILYQILANLESFKNVERVPFGNPATAPCQS